MPRNRDDREPQINKDFTQKHFEKLFADKEYISQDLFEALFVDDKLFSLPLVLVIKLI